MQEHFPKDNTERTKNRLNVMIQKSLEERPADAPPIPEKEWEKLRVFQEHFIDALSEEAKETLLELSDEKFQQAIGGILHYYSSNENRSIEQIADISLDIIKNFLAYKEVYGYGHPDVEKRKEENPLPTAQEVLMGCYSEQLEKQTREAVLTLRKKGYNTVESGFRDTLMGSQFFHLKEEVQTTVPEELIKEMKERFGVDMVFDRDRAHTHIEFVPNNYKSLEEWKEVLDEFAEKMPAVKEAGFAILGGAVYFAFETITTYKKEEILKTAVIDTERELIEKLYQCKTKNDIAQLIGIDQNDWGE